MVMFMQNSQSDPVHGQSGSGTVGRVPRRLWSWRTGRAVLIALASMIALLAAVWMEEDWRGQRAWERYAREWEAKGERFKLAAFLPKPVPADQNFAATPFLAPLLEYNVVHGAMHWRDPEAVARIMSVSTHGAISGRGNWPQAQFADLVSAQERLDRPVPAESKESRPAQNILLALWKEAPVLAELYQATERPYAVFSSHMDESPTVALQQFGALKNLTQVAVLRALALLEEGRSAEALADVKVTFRLAQLLRSKPLLISELVRMANIKSALQPVWEGLARQRWTDLELRQLQEWIGSVGFLEEYGVAMRGERAFGCEFTAQTIAGHIAGESAGQQPLRALLPRGMLYQNQVVICRMFQEILLAAVDPGQHRDYPEKCRDEAFFVLVGRHTPNNLLARMLFPAIQKSAQQCAFAQTSMDLAAVACALERYRLANQRYPESLDALVPAFIGKLPTDVMNGQPLHYQLREGKTMALYAVGWNQTDDHAQVSSDLGKGDWVWQYPLSQ